MVIVQVQTHHALASALFAQVCDLGSPSSLPSPSPPLSPPRMKLRDVIFLTCPCNYRRPSHQNRLRTKMDTLFCPRSLPACGWCRVSDQRGACALGAEKLLPGLHLSGLASTEREGWVAVLGAGLWTALHFCFMHSLYNLFP